MAPCSTPKSLLTPDGRREVGVSPVSFSVGVTLSVSDSETESQTLIVSECQSSPLCIHVRSDGSRPWVSFTASVVSRICNQNSHRGDGRVTRHPMGNCPCSKHQFDDGDLKPRPLPALPPQMTSSSSNNSVGDRAKRREQRRQYELDMQVPDDVIFSTQ